MRIGRKEILRRPDLGNYSTKAVNLSDVVDAVVKGTTQPDMNRFAASEALDYIEEYYKVCYRKLYLNKSS